MNQVVALFSFDVRDHYYFYWREENCFLNKPSPSLPSKKDNKNDFILIQTLESNVLFINMLAYSDIIESLKSYPKAIFLDISIKKWKFNYWKENTLDAVVKWKLWEGLFLCKKCWEQWESERMWVVWCTSAHAGTVLQGTTSKHRNIDDPLNCML